MSSRKICDECAGRPLTFSVHDVVPRRPITAVLGSPAPSSKPIATSAPFAAATSAARAASCGSPADSSSPVITTVTCMPFSAPAFSSARAPRA